MFRPLATRWCVCVKKEKSGVVWKYALGTSVLALAQLY